MQPTADADAVAEGEPRAEDERLDRGAARAARHVLAGASTAAVMCVADALHATLDESGERVAPGDFVLAMFHLLAFYAPIGLALGVAMLAIAAITERTPLLAPVARRLAPRRALDRDPEGFATGVAALVSIGALVVTSRWVFDLLVTRVHRMDLAAWAMGGLALAVVLVALLAGAVVRIALLPLARRIGRAASPGVLALVLLIGGALVLWLVAAPALAPIIEAYGWAPLLWAPGALAAYAAAFAVVGWAMRRRSVRGRRAWLAMGLTLVVSVTLLFGSALSYGASNTVRGVVEARSVAGLPLLRRYARLTDMDGDGHAWAFGGRDCDDFDARVFPGAYDEPGDGIDADCFMGDGSPTIDELGDGHLATMPGGFPSRPNIVLFTIDALRPDHLSVSGYERDTSPNIDRFAAEAVRFEHVLAPSSRSIRSIPAMMTGFYPSQIAYGPEYLYPSLLEENDTVAEILRGRGYRTAVTMGTFYFHRTNGFFQGFDEVQEVMFYKPPRERTVDDAIRQLDTLVGQPQPFFQWVHLFGVHQGYLDPPAPSRYGPEDVDKYDTEIRLADEQLQRYLDALDARGLGANTVVVLASDHGEEFGEHGNTGHSSSLYEEQLRAVLMVRAPQIEPRVVGCPVGLVDLAPTLINLARARVPEPMPARSLAPFMLDEDAVCPTRAEEPRYLFAELLPDGLFPWDLKSIQRGDDKLIWWVQEGRVQLFDLARDPDERDDLSDDRPAQAEELLGLLQAWSASSSRPQNRTDAYVREHLLDARPARMSHPLDLRYPGLFTVLGCDLPETELRPREVIHLTCYYEVTGETDMDLFFRVMLEPPPGVRLPHDFHALHYPLDSRYRTPRWRRGQIIADPMHMVVPPEIQTPLDLRLTFAVHVRGEGLQGFSQAGRTAHSATIDTIRIRPPADAEP